MASLWTTLVLWIAAYAIWRAYKVIRALRAYPQVPRLYCVVEPLSVLGGYLIPRGKWNPGSYVTWGQTEALYAARGSETILIVPIFWGSIELITSSPEGCKDIFNDPNGWVKPQKITTLGLLGANVVASNPPVWRRHRKIGAPAFDNQTFADVWEVTFNAYKEMSNSAEWKGQDRIYFPSFNKITTRLAILVIATCGFNMPLPWVQDKGKPVNMIDETVVTVSTHIMERAFLPKWMFMLPSLKYIDTAYKNFERFLNDEIAAKKVELAREIKLDGAVSKANKNVFGRFVAASEQEGSQGLSTRELIGNLFIFMFAGHETTAHSLVLSLAFLACDTKEQDRVVNHIRSVIGDADPTYEDYGALLPVLHIFYEVIRLYPPGWVTIREAAGDQALQAPSLTSSGEPLAVPNGSCVILDVIGACRNPRVFPNPDAFVPTRWAVSDDPNAPPPPSMDTFIGFASGPRMCLGKKFASVEAVCFLTLLLRDWKVDIKLEAGETVEQWQKRFLHPNPVVTLTVGDVPLLFTRRKKE